jgi:hypothetical protein
MQRIAVVLLVFYLVGTSAALAADPPAERSVTTAVAQAGTDPGPSEFRKALVRHTAGITAWVRADQQMSRPEPQPRRRSWIGRHPALFGTIAGAGGGLVAAATMENELFCSGGDEDCLIHGDGRVLAGAGIGAGIGALTGFFVGLATR